MKKTVISAAILALLVGNAYSETVNGKFQFHSKDGKVVGLKTATGQLAFVDGPQLQAKGVFSIDSFKTCDDVAVEYAMNGKQRIVNAVTLIKKADGAACEQPMSALPVGQFNKALAEKSSTIVDVRSAEEFAKGHLDGAINLPLGEIEGRFSELPKDKPILIYCHSGRRAGFAAALLQEKGISTSFVKGKFTIKDGKPQIIE